MLRKFTVENFRSFKEPITIDFTAKRDYQFGQTCIRNGLLSKILVVGKNSSGKSNLGYALFDIVQTLTDKHLEQFQNDPLSFLNADSDVKNARFEYEFIQNDKIINYTYKKTDPQTMAEEELSIDGNLIYRYDFSKPSNKELHLERINTKTLNFDYYEKNLPILRYIANNSTLSEDSPVKFIMDYVSGMLWFRTLQRNGYIGLKTGSEKITDWIIEQGKVEELSSFLNQFSGIKVDLHTASIEKENIPKMIVDVHKEKPLLLEDTASSGVKALLMFYYWSNFFDKVTLMFMDEFDAFYHNDTAKKVLESVSALQNIQAIFTSHNTSLVSNQILRPDCYLQLAEGKLCSFADLTDRELREAHNLEKMLRNGEFDAI